MLQAILAMTPTGGIGFQGRLPWVCQEELKLFRTLTLDKTLVVGRKTWDTLPPLPRRHLIVLTRQPSLNTHRHANPPIMTVPSLQDVDVPAFVAGGASVYKEAFASGRVSRVHLSVMKSDYPCDTYIELDWLDNYGIESYTEYQDFFHFTLGIKLKPSDIVSSIKCSMQSLRENAVVSTRRGKNVKNR